MVFGTAGLVSATAGALGLLARRLLDVRLRHSSNLSDFRNLGVLLATFLSAGHAWLATDNSFALLGRYLWGIATFSPHAAPFPIVFEVAVASLFLLYLPFTPMIHFVAKYFSYHQVRWDDRPSSEDPKLAGKMVANLARPVPWSAAHIPQDSDWARATSEVK